LTPAAQKLALAAALLAISALLLAASLQSAEIAEWYRGALLWIREQQTLLHQDLKRGVLAIRREGLSAAWPLISLSFLYGLLHAAGPGHGKVILATYLLTQKSALLRGVWLAALAALLQGATAILLVLSLFWLLGLSSREAQGGALLAEQASYLLILLLGALLMLRAARALKAARRPAGEGHADHDHSGGQAACHHCGHAHAPDAKALESASFRQSLAVVLSIGLRPCSGAIIVLLATEALGLRFAGVLSVLAMSLGTALAVAGIAAFSVGARGMAARLVTLEESRLRLVSGAVAFSGGLVILAFGASLFLASLGNRHPLI
jgi:ABC-type nickel/cobalt efflux system permease component RcnA